jgi:SAM-dependent methyltransferase
MRNGTIYPYYRADQGWLLKPNCTDANSISICNCSVPPALPQLRSFLANARGKAKFLEATEDVLTHEPDVCVPGNRLLDVGAGGGEFARWLAERCGFCAKAYDVALAADNPYRLLHSKNVSITSARSSSTSSTSSTSSSGESSSDLGARHFETFHVLPFDGRSVPETSRSFELVVLNSMLHHAAANAPALLREAARITTQSVLVFEDLAVPDDGRITERHRIHDASGIFRTQDQWEELFADANLRVDMTGPVGSVMLSNLKGQKHARLDWRHQRYFLLRLGARRRIPDASVTAALQAERGRSRVLPENWNKRRCSRIDGRYGPTQCHDVNISSRVNFFYYV